MTSDRDEEAAARAYISGLLRAPPAARHPYDDSATAERRRLWHRATEQERRRMLKDCGWL